MTAVAWKSNHDRYVGEIHNGTTPTARTPWSFELQNCWKQKRKHQTQSRWPHCSHFHRNAGARLQPTAWWEDWRHPAAGLEIPWGLGRPARDPGFVHVQSNPATMRTTRQVDTRSQNQDIRLRRVQRRTTSFMEVSHDLMMVRLRRGSHRLTNN
jgi:hypothetical protein